MEKAKMTEELMNDILTASITLFSKLESLYREAKLLKPIWKKVTPNIVYRIVVDAIYHAAKDASFEFSENPSVAEFFSSVSSSEDMNTQVCRSLHPSTLPDQVNAGGLNAWASPKRHSALNVNNSEDSSDENQANPATLTRHTIHPCDASHAPEKNPQAMSQQLTEFKQRFENFSQSIDEQIREISSRIYATLMEEITKSLREQIEQGQSLHSKSSPQLGELLKAAVQNVELTWENDSASDDDIKTMLIQLNRKAEDSSNPCGSQSQRLETEVTEEQVTSEPGFRAEGDDGSNDVQLSAHLDQHLVYYDQLISEFLQASDALIDA